MAAANDSPNTKLPPRCEALSLGRAALHILAIILACFIPAACEQPDSFEVINVSAQGNTAARNETIRIRFNRRISRESPLKLVQARSQDGRRINTRARFDGNSVLIEPTDPMGWPTGQLELVVGRGHAGAFRSTDGLGLTRNHQSGFSVQDRFQDFGEPFLLEAAPPGAISNVRSDAIFEYRFSLPVDEQSIPSGINMFLITPSNRRAWCQPHISLSDDRQSLYVKPFHRNSSFHPAREYRIHLTGRLRALTGRALDSTYRPLVLVTADIEAQEGFVDISFASGDLTSRDNPLVERNGTYALPGVDLNPVVMNGQYGHPLRSESTTVPWSPDSSRIQILIDGRHLGGDTGWITGFSWYSVDPVPSGIIFPQVVLRIGPARSGTLGNTFDENFLGRANRSGLRDSVLKTVTSGSGGAGWLPAPQPSGWYWMPFETPYFYEGGFQDIVLEINNMQGGSSGSRNFPGLSWACGEKAGASPATLLATGSNGYGTHGDHQNVVLATKIRFERYVDIVSRWYKAGVSNPAWYDLGTVNDLDASGTRDYDFLFLFQGRHQNGTTTDWIPCDDRLQGCSELRARIIYLDGTRPDLGNPPEIRRLRVRYRKIQ